MAQTKKPAVTRPASLTKALAQAREREKQAKESKAHFDKLARSYAEMYKELEKSTATYEALCASADQRSRQMDQFGEEVRHALAKGIERNQVLLDANRSTMSPEAVQAAEEGIADSRQLLENVPRRLN